ncbi:MAG TPA: sensor histidine kinase [Telluria sp.]|nr:sensor histidine kinase [Telluria sp.]
MRRRIVHAYLAFGLAFCTLFAIFAAITVESIEVRLVDDRLEAVAAWAAPRHAGGLPVEMPAGVSFHHAPSIPASLRGLADGVHERTVDGHTLHVYAGRDATGEFVVADHNSDYVHIEYVVYSMLALTFAGFLLLSAVLGGFVARRFVNPITMLAQAVREGRDQPALARRPDELGQLAEAFMERTKSLDSALERERAFAGDVSHELRTPLTVIMGAAEVLQARGAGQPAFEAPARRIYSAASEATNVITTLLVLARSGGSFEKQQVDINAVARNEVQRYQVLVAEKPVQLRLEEHALVTVPGQRELCGVAIGNLIRNACQYTASGEVVVAVYADRIEVRDTGPGVPEQVLATLDGKAGAGSGGTGLGLSLTQRICTTLGCALSHTRPGPRGSQFTIHFHGP